MQKNVLKKSLSDITASLSIVLLGFLAAASFSYLMNYTAAQRLFFFDMLFRVICGLSIITTLGILAHHFIMLNDLLPRSKKLRIVISASVFAILTIVVDMFIFSVIPSAYKQFAIIGIIIIAAVAFSTIVIGCLIENKTQKQDIEIINKRLGELQKED